MEWARAVFDPGQFGPNARRPPIGVTGASAAVYNNVNEARRRVPAMFDLQKKSHFYRMQLRNVDRQVEPFFSSVLVCVSTFMSVLLFGAGSIFGGIVFLIPLIAAALVYWDEVLTPSHDDAA